MQGVGIDVVDLSRMRQARYPERVAEYVLREAERRDMKRSRDPIQYLGSRLALKEAVIKACTVPLNLQDVEIAGLGARPIVRITHPDASNLSIHASLSHTPELSIAVAVIA